MRNHKRAIIVFVALWPVAAYGQTALEVKASGRKTFYANSRAGNNQVTIFSESTIEDFTGVCNQVGGQCEFDPKNVESFKGKFSIRVEDMKTGIDLRDKELCSADWLDAKLHPRIEIDITSVDEVVKAAPNTASMVLVGKCSLHGQTRDVRIPATLRFLDESPKTMRRVKGDLIRIRAKWVVKLSDYGISGPKASDVIGLKVANDIELRITVFCATERPPNALKADEPASDAARRPPPKRGEKGR